jgi:hypothetical protein
MRHFIAPLVFVIFAFPALADKPPGAATTPRQPCYTGLVIVEEVKPGKKQTPRIELQGCPAEFIFYHMGQGNADPPNFNGMIGKTIKKNPNGKTAGLVLTADPQGRYLLPPMGGEDPAPYLKLKSGQPFFYKASGAELGKLFEAVQLTDMVTQHRKMTPFLMPNIAPPTYTVTQMTGDFITGTPYHMMSESGQLSVLTGGQSGGK